jgi:hypothetical protein
MVTDYFPDKKGANGWASYSRSKGYKVSMRKTQKGYAVTRTRKRRR